jgi:hypothetical protein
LIGTGGSIIKMSHLNAKMIPVETILGIKGRRDKGE